MKMCRYNRRKGGSWSKVHIKEKSSGNGKDNMEKRAIREDVINTKRYGGRDSKEG